MCPQVSALLIHDSWRYEFFSRACGPGNVYNGLEVERQLTAFRLCSARSLLGIGINLKGKLSRLTPVKIPSHESKQHGDKHYAYFFLLLNDKDLADMSHSQDVR